MSNDESRRIVLARRARFLAAALAGIGLAGQACGGDTERDGENTAGAGGQAGAMQGDGGNSAAGTSSGGNAGAPQPCLAPLPPDAGVNDAGDGDAATTDDAGVGTAGAP